MVWVGPTTTTSCPRGFGFPVCHFPVYLSIFVPLPVFRALPPVLHQMKKFDATNVQVRRRGIRRLPLADYMEARYTEQDPLYLFTTNFSETRNAPTEAARRGLVAEVEVTPWAPEINSSVTVAMGRAGSGLPLHWHDEAVQELVEGAKHWTLFPPTTTPFADPARTHGQWLAGQPPHVKSQEGPAPFSW